MIPFFKRINVNENGLDVRTLAARINEMQEELESCLSDLSSDNVTDISTDSTTLSSDLGSELKGDIIRLKGRGGEEFAAGYDKELGAFEFYLKDKNGNYIFAYTEEDGLITQTEAAAE